MHARGKTLFRSENGSGMIEFALILPIFIALSLAVIESGNMFRSWLTLNKSAQMAARFAATGQGDEEGTRLSLIMAEARKLETSLPGANPVMEVEVCSRPGLDASAPCVGGQAGGPCEMVEVNVRYVYSPATPLLGNLMSDTLVLSGSDRKINEPWRICP